MSDATTFDRLYGTTSDAFGRDPEPLLVRFADQLPAGGAALDLGAGQGRNAVFLARRGHRVDALDPSAVAVATLRRLAAEHGLPIEPHAIVFEDHAGPERGYAAVLAFGLVPLLDGPAIDLLASRLRAWTAPGGLAFVTGFTTDDPGYEAVATSCDEIGPRSFRRPDGELRTYLQPGEARARFADLDLVHAWEGLGPEHRHGDAPPERHGVFELVLRALARSPN